jgi:hypothetical protein
MVFRTVLNPLSILQLKVVCNGYTKGWLMCSKRHYRSGTLISLYRADNISKETISGIPGNMTGMGNLSGKIIVIPKIRE